MYVVTVWLFYCNSWRQIFFACYWGEINNKVDSSCVWYNAVVETYIVGIPIFINKNSQFSPVSCERYVEIVVSEYWNCNNVAFSVFVCCFVMSGFDNTNSCIVDRGKSVCFEYFNLNFCFLRKNNMIL